MWDVVPFSELISPSILDTCTVAKEEVAALGASASSVEAGTSPGDEVDAGVICSSSSPLKPSSSSSIKILYSISLSPALSKTS
jgi:hypothetical protein